MLQHKTYKFSELNAIIKESTNNGFKPVLGKGVEGDNKKNNEKAVKDIDGDVKKYNGGVNQKKEKFDRPFDGNKTTLDLRFETKPGKEWEDRVKSQVHGFSSTEEEKNGSAKDNDSLDFDGNKEIEKSFEENSKKRKEAEEDLANAGLMGRELKKYNKLNEMKKMKRLHFKNTVFINEADILNRVPEQYKTDGNRFKMKDATGTEYLCECTVDSRLGYKKVSVVGKMNKTVLNEELDRMRQLFGYESKDYFKGVQKGNESIKFMSESIDKVKKLEEEFDNECGGKCNGACPCPGCDIPTDVDEAEINPFDEESDK